MSILTLSRNASKNFFTILLKVVYKKWPGKENEEADNRSEKLAENEKYLTQEVVGATYNITEDNFKDKSKDE